MTRDAVSGRRIIPEPLPPTSQPTAERQRHAERIEAPDVNGHAFRPGWRVSTRLDGLLRDELIDSAAWLAGNDFRSDFEKLAGTPGSPLSRIGMPRAPITVGAGDGAGGRLAAAGRLRRIHERIGAKAYAVVIMAVVLDLSWPELGRRLGLRDHKTAKRRAVTAIQALVLGSAPGGTRQDDPAG